MKCYLIITYLSCPATEVGASCCCINPVDREDPEKQAALDELQKGNWVGVAGKLEIYNPGDKPPRMTVRVQSMARIRPAAGAEAEGEGEDEEDE
jgi:hypothetical protein